MSQFCLLGAGFIDPEISPADCQVCRDRPTGEISGLGSRTVVAVSIQETDKGLHFYLPSVSVLEGAGVVEIKVARGDDGSSPVRVDYATTDATARAGQDYTSTSGTLVFDPGEVMKSIQVPISNDAVLEPARIFRVALSNPIDGAIGSPAEATVTIQDTDQTLQFESTICRAREESEYVQISIVQGENEASATVDVTTTNGTAIAGSDYLGLTNTVHFAPGERLKRIQIPILNDELKEAAKSFLVRLSNPSAGTALGPRRTATVITYDNDSGVGFTSTKFFAPASAGAAEVVVRRSSDAPIGPLTVEYETVDGSARAGVDYHTRSGTLEFNADETLQAITIPLLQNAAATGQKSFRITLSDPSGTLPLGTVTAMVNICNPGGNYPVLPAIRTQSTLRHGGWHNAAAPGPGPPRIRDGRCRDAQLVSPRTAG